MATVEAKAAPEEDVKAPPTSTENTSRTASDNTRDQATDSTAARNTLLDQVLTTYADAGVTGAKPVREGATTGDDGFGLVDGPSDNRAADSKPVDPKPAETKQDATDVAQMVFIPVMEQPPAEFPRTLFGVELDPDKLLNDKPEGDIDFGLGQSYDGGFLKMNVRPTNYEVRSGETLEQIARKHLGPKATQDDVDIHVAEIERANVKTLAGRDSETYEGKKGEIFRLPGHTADGADLYKDHRGTIYRVTEDGKMKVTYLDGSGFERVPNDDGGITKNYFGKKPEDNYSVTLDKNGKVVENTRVDPNHKPAQDLATETKRLEALADKGLGIKNEREQFKKDMQEFIKTAKKNGLPESEVAQTFAEVSRILEASGPGQPMTSRERARLATGIMRGAAYPESGNQGGHNTCTLQVMENRGYAREPSTNARILADVATTGKFVAADGTVVRMDPADLRAHGEGANNPYRGQNMRTYASQIFQVTAGNTFYTNQNEGRVPPGDVRYSQVKPQGGLDTGERVIDYNRSPATAKKGDPGEVATVGNINDMAYLLNGKDEDNVFISNEVMSPSDNRDPSRTNFSSPQELIERLTAAKAEGKPMSVGLGVFSNGEPFYDSMVKKGVTPFDVESSVAGLVQDAHAVRVIGFEPETGMVQIDNQWGDENDIISKPISVYELYNATKPVPPTEWMRRLGDRWDNETPEANARNLKSVMGASFFNWSINQEARGIPVDERAKQAVMDRYVQLVDKLPPAQQEDVRRTIEQYNKDWEFVRQNTPKKAAN